MVNFHSGARLAHHIAPPRPASDPQSSQTLASQLTQAFSTFLQQSGIDASGFNLSIQANSGTVSGTAAVVQSGTAASAGAPAKLGFNALIPPDTLPPQAAQSAPATQHWYGADAADDAWWAKQPKPVQQFREIQDMSQRQTLATQLAGQGYQIDVPVMVWGWDAAKTTALRASAGYTWVPSALQNPVSAAPGITGPGITPYDPNHPPPGSMLVG